MHGFTFNCGVCLKEFVRGRICPGAQNTGLPTWRIPSVCKTLLFVTVPSAPVTGRIMNSGSDGGRGEARWYKLEEVWDELLELGHDPGILDPNSSGQTGDWEEDDLHSDDTPVFEKDDDGAASSVISSGVWMD